MIRVHIIAQNNSTIAPSIRFSSKKTKANKYMLLVVNILVVLGIKDAGFFKTGINTIPNIKLAIKTIKFNSAKFPIITLPLYNL